MNVSSNTTFHCRFCYYIGDWSKPFGNLSAFDNCKFKADTNDFLLPKNAVSEGVTLRRTQEIERKTNPALVVVEVPEGCTSYGIVNILGRMQDLQLRLGTVGVVITNYTGTESIISDRIAMFYKLRMYQALRWCLKTESGETEVLFEENEGRLVRII